MQLSVLTSTISRNAGGLFESVRHLHAGVAKDIHTKVLSFRDSHTDNDIGAWEGIPVEICPYIGPKSLRFSPALGKLLNQDKPDLIHVHGLWQGTSIAALNYHNQTGVPHLISPRGMLDPWALANSRWKKQLAARLFERSHLESAACLHALCQSEVEAMRSYGLKNPIALIPNGVNLPKDSGNHEPVPSEKKTLLFIGRIHPKKGLPLALKAWGNTQMRDEWQFVIAGWDQNGHSNELKTLCNKVGISSADVPLDRFLKDPSQFSSNEVVFVGPAFDSQKSDLLCQSNAFILPSFSEGMPMSILEAWAHGLPVVMTQHCNLPEGFTAGAAIQIQPDVTSTQRGLADLVSMSLEELESMGVRGRGLVHSKFTWNHIAEQMSSIYRWVLEGSNLPDCVICD